MLVLSLLALLLTATSALIVLPDGRKAHILKDDEAVSAFILQRVAELANSAIAEKGGFSMSIGSGTTVKPLSQLADAVSDFTNFHVFFGNERTEGESAGKCFAGTAEFATACGLPPANLHRAPMPLAAAAAAEEYEATLRSMDRSVVGECARTGLPALDLVLLGSGADGHCASLYPESSQVVCSPGCDRAYLEAEGKGGITLSIDAIGSARHVLLSAAKRSQADMVRKCLGWSNAATNTQWPAGMISAAADNEVTWLLTEASAIDLPAL